eukprot:1178085-Rhodomonas_salina.2
MTEAQWTVVEMRAPLLKTTMSPGARVRLFPSTASSVEASGHEHLAPGPSSASVEVEKTSAQSVESPKPPLLVEVEKRTTKAVKEDENVTPAMRGGCGSVLKTPVTAERSSKSNCSRYPAPAWMMRNSVKLAYLLQSI